MNKSPNIIIPGRHAKRGQIVDHNTIELTEKDSEEQAQAKVEMWVANRLGARLVKIYPNTNWNVQVDMTGGTVVVSNPDVSSKRGYHIDLNRSINEIEQMLGSVGGEILERGRLARAGVDPDDVENRVRNLRDEVVDLDNS
jgi:hypothetical protein